MDGMRWTIFKLLSRLGWWICPEPHKTNLQRVMPSWESLERNADYIEAEVRKRVSGLWP